MKQVKAIPDGYHAITPYLTIKGAVDAIDFYVRAFDAKELFRMPAPDDKFGHAELLIGDSKIMLADESPVMGNKSPLSLGGSPVTIHLYVEKSDAVFEKAIAAGGQCLHPVDTKFYGDRGGAIIDPFGHVWFISTHVEDVPIDELMQRAADMHKNCAGGDKK